MIKNVLFDLDGTLTDPGLGITNSIMYAFRKLGFEVPEREKLYKYIGPPLIDSFKADFGMSDELARTTLYTYREYFSTKGLFENEPYAGIDVQLKKLNDAGCKLYVTTSKPEQFAVRILEHFGLAEYFTIICGASMDEKREKKADVIRYTLERAGKENESSDSVMVGDRYADIVGARETGLKSVGVLWGYGSADELENEHPDAICPEMSELAETILRLQ